MLGGRGRNPGLPENNLLTLRLKELLTVREKELLTQAKKKLLDFHRAQQRAEYGYKDVRPQPLLRSFAGKPYVDIRASFNSFIPVDLSDELTERLVDFYLDWLKDHPHLHDKVEFEVVPTCFGPKFDRWEERLSAYGNLTHAEVDQLRSGLKEITNTALFRVKADLDSLHILEKRYELVAASSLDSKEKARQLLDDCKKYGTLAFAHLARGAFVAVTLLREGVEAGWLSKDARDGFLESVQTVTHELSRDGVLVREGTMSWEQFIQKYGHLRPGTYDITSPSYKDNPDYFLKPLIGASSEQRGESAKLDSWIKEKGQYFSRLRSMGLSADDTEFEYFLKQSIAGRERAKFLFSKNLSMALDLLGEIGETELGLAVEELANLSIFELWSAMDDPNFVGEKKVQLKQRATTNQINRMISSACQLPPLLMSEEDFWIFALDEEKPNFIGTQRITAELVTLSESRDIQKDVENSIVLIPVNFLKFSHSNR